MSKKRFLSIFAFLFAVLFAFALGFGLSACGKDKDEDDDDDKGSTTPTHTHSYVLDEDADWEWSDDFSTYTHAATCTNEDGLCDAVNGVISAEVTHDTTEATCTEDGKIVHTAKYNQETLDTQEEPIPAKGHTLTSVSAKPATCIEDGNSAYWYCSACEKCFSDADCETETTLDATIVPATGHTYNNESEGENAWHWYVSADGTTYTATVELTCSECHETQTVDAEVSGPDENDDYTGTYMFSEDVVFTDTHTPAGEEEEIPESEHTYTVTITTTKTNYIVGDTESLGATVYCDGQPTSDSVTWSIVANPAECATIADGALTAVSEGGATITATYTYGDGGNDFVTDTLEITITAQQETYTVEITNANKDYLVVYVNGETLTLTAVVKDGGGNEITVQDGKLVWSVVAGYEGYAIIEQNTGIVTGEAQGTAAFVATYTDGNNNTWTSDPVYVIVQPEVKIPDGSPYSVSVDFANPSEDLKTSIQTGGTIVIDEKGLLTLVDTSNEWSVESGYLSTGTNGYTKQTTDVYTYTNYFMLDFAEFGGYSYEMTLTFASATGDGSVAIMNALVENAGGSGSPTEIFHTDSAPDLSEDVNLGHGRKAASTGTVEWTYSGTTGLDGSTVLYLVWDSTMQIYGIDIELWTGERPVDLDKDTWSGVEIDFANPPDEFNLTYGNPESYTGDGRTVMSGGVFTIIDSDYAIEWTSGNGYMTTGGATKEQQYPEAGEDAALTNYIKINLGGLEGQSVVITIVFSSADEGEGTLAIVTAPEDLSNGGNATNLVGNDTSAQVTTKTKFSVVVTVPADGIMYIEYNASLNIYSMKIALGSEPDTSADYTVEIDDVSVDSTTLDVDGTATGFVAKITENGIEKQLSDIAGATLEWKSSNTNVATVTVDANGTVTVTAVSSGYAKITVILTVGDIVIESGAIGILVNIGDAEEGTLRYNFTSGEKGWDTTLSSTSSTISLDNDGTLKYHTSQYNQGWKQDPDGVYGFMTGEKDDYGATFGSSENYSNYFEIATGNAIEMTISVTFSATSVKKEGYWVESEDQETHEKHTYWVEPEDNSTGFVALLPSLPSYTMSVGGSNTATRKGNLTGGTLSNDYQSYLIDSTAIEETNGIGYSNAVTFTWTGSVKDYEKIYIFLGASMYIYDIDISFEYHQHTYGAEGISWGWVSTDNGWTISSATMTCTDSDCDGTEGATLTAQVTMTTETTQTSCDVAGEMTYTATATFAGVEYTDTKTVPVAAGSHDYGAPVYKTTSDDGIGTDGWYLVCSKGDSSVLLTSGEGYTFNVASEAELGGALTLAGAAIVVNDNITVTATVNAAASVTLNLNGKTISGEISNALISVASGTLEISDSIGGGAISNAQGIAITITGGMLSLISGTISGATALTVSAGEAEIKGGTITGTTLAISIINSGASVAITDAGVTVNGALNATEGGFNITAGTFSEDPTAFLDTAGYIATQNTTDQMWVVEEFVNNTVFYINFGEPSTYEWMNSVMGNTGEASDGGRVSFHAEDQAPVLDSGSGYLTVGYIQYTYNTKNTYFKINVSDLQGQSVKIKIGYSATSSSSGTNLVVSKSMTTGFNGNDSSVLAYDTTYSTNKGCTSTSKIEVEWEVTITSSISDLYVQFSTNPGRIYYIDIEIV